MADYLHASDVYVSTSLSDGTSASLLEAMTLKVPPVVTEIQGNKEWITDAQNGYLVPVNDVRSLSEKIILLIRDKEMRKALGENARATVEEKANWRTSTQAFDSLIKRLTLKKSED